MPPLQNYAPSEYNGENQNWAITQSRDRLIYIANNKNLLEFNGAEWMRYPSPNETVIRSVKAIGNRIYSGCYMEFGYWQKDKYGVLQYTSLSKRLRIDFLPDEEFWSILDIEDWVVFQSPNRIYVYNVKDDTIYTIDAETSLSKAFNVGQSIYFQKTNKGIYRIGNGKASLVFDDPIVRDDEVVGIFEEGQQILVLTKHNGFFKSKEESLVKWNIAAEDEISEVSVYGSIQLKDGSFALGTISHGLIHIDRMGNLLNYINQLNGLRNNTVLSLFEDVDNNIWLGLDHGISYANLKSPYRVFHDNKGIVGSVYAATVRDSILYLGTNQGLFYKDFRSRLDFKMIEGTEGQVWSLNTIGETLFCGHHKGTFTIKGTKAEKVAKIQGTWKIGKLEGDKDHVLQGNYDGLHILERRKGEWYYKNKINGFENSSRYVEVIEGKIFVSHEYKGVFKIEALPDFSAVKAVTVDTLIKGSNSGLVRYKGDLLYAYKEGIFKYDKREAKFVKDSLLSNAFTENEYVSGKLMVDEANKHLWIFTASAIVYISEGELDSSPRINTIPLAENIRNGIVGYESVTPLIDDFRYAFGTTSGYIVVRMDDLNDSNFEVGIGTIREAGKNTDSSKKDIVDKSEEGNFETNDNNLEISFYTTQFNKYVKPQFQYQLLGRYEKWSDWSNQARVSFENLPSGSYTFNVRARIGGEISSNMASYAFSIARPWYFSNLMWGIYFLGALLASMLVHSLYKRYYHNYQKKLIEESEREMELARAQSEKEIIALKNKQLKNEYKSKSNELAASTMSIIKKNELLSKVKAQLVATVEDKNLVKPIIHLIDKSLNQNDDWELFKEAFNNADRRFLKKLKKAHSNLSPNDIRLCAYLRLNLSSKEIAPLLNISARSVEIKRYRLRKKMNLSHEANLVDYILKL
ncbi:MAG: LuxR C-terminal-related transcriptional regulator [Bacteroidota bacterium]